MRQRIFSVLAIALLCACAIGLSGDNRTKTLTLTVQPAPTNTSTLPGPNFGAGTDHFADDLNNAGGVTNTLANTARGTVQAGSLWCAWLDWDCGPSGGCSSPRNFVSISDDAANTYAQQGSEHSYLGSGSADTTRLYCTVNKATGVRTTTYSVSSTSDARFIGSYVFEYRNVSSTPIDAVTWSTASGTNPTASITTATDNETVVSILGAGGTTSPTAGTGYNLRYQGDGAVFPFGIEDAGIANHGAVTIRWNDAVSQNYGIWSMALRGAAPPPVSGTLLAGKTPATLGTPPSGWTLATTQDFEVALGNATGGTSLATDKVHSGSKSMKATYTGDGQGPSWWFEQLPSASREVYVSWYEWLDTPFRENDEIFFAMFKKQFSNGNQLTRLQYEYMDLGGGSLGFNTTSARLFYFPEGVATYSPQIDMINQDDSTQITGRWVQWEIHYKGNTVSNGVGNSDGVWQVWRNGTQIGNYTNIKLNGNLDMNGMLIGIGGTYTKQVWFGPPATSDPSTWSSSTCATAPGFYSDNTHRCPSFTNCTPCGSPTNGAPTQNVPVFSRWWDDIIILYR